MTECEIFRQVPVPGFPGIGLFRRMNELRSRSDHRKKERPHRAVRVFVADGETELLDHRLIDGTAHMQESCSAVEPFVQPSMNSESKAGSARQNMNRQFSFAFLWIDPANDGQAISADLVDVVRIESDVRINPQCLLKAVGESIAGDLIASLIERRFVPVTDRAAVMIRESNRPVISSLIAFSPPFSSKESRDINFTRNLRGVESEKLASELQRHFLQQPRFQTSWFPGRSD